MRLAVAVAALFCLGSVYMSAEAEGASCSNESFRAGFGALLPDCRAYERATPQDKEGGSAAGTNQIVKASQTGDGVTFFSGAGISNGAGAQDFPSYLAVRNGDEWLTQGLLPPGPLGGLAQVLGVSQDFQYVVTAAGNFGTGAQGGIGMFIEDTHTHSIATIVPYQPEAEGTATVYALDGISEDGEKVFFESSLALTGETTPFVNNLYVWDRPTGKLELAGRLPKGEGVLPNEELPPSATFGGPYDWPNKRTVRGGAMRRMYVAEAHAISPDGNQIYFTAAENAQGEAAQIYLRRGLNGPKPETVRVSKPNPGVSDPNGPKPAAFVEATQDGASAIFISSGKLTADANTGAADEGSDLYKYNASSETLTDLTPDVLDASGASVQGVLGMTGDGSSIYFVAGGALAPGATTADCAVEEVCNLYHYQEVGGTRTITFIAQLNAFGGLGLQERNDSRDWSPTAQAASVDTSKTARVSADGQVLLFASRRSLTGYDNEPAGEARDCGNGCSELFRYSAATKQITCLSCSPLGIRPIHSAILSNNRINVELPPNGFLPANLTRNLSADGDIVFFQTADPLVEGDTNGALGCPQRGARVESSSCMDVYEWEASNTGTCQAPSANGGCLSLLSTGQSDQPSYFADADDQGRNAFFFTQSRLVPSDRDELYDVYDASEDGGLPSQNEVLTTKPCSGEECQGQPTQEPGRADPASATLVGPENPKPKPHKKKPKPKCKQKKGKGQSCKASHPKKKHPHGKSKHSVRKKSGGSK